VQYGGAGDGMKETQKKQLQKPQKQKQGKKKEKSDRYRKTFTIRDVVAHVHSDRLEQRIQKMSSGATRGSKEWLAAYPLALNRLVEQLRPDERTEAEEMADEWTQIGPPTALKAA